MAATTIYCDYSAADDTGAGTIGDPYKTMQKAHDVIHDRNPGSTQNGADTTVWLKNTVPYEESVSVKEETTGSGTKPMAINGYADTPGDGGVATFDGTNTKVNAFTLLGTDENNVYFWVVNDIRFTRYTGPAWDGRISSALMDSVSFQHCRFDNSDIGCEASGQYRFLDCWFHDNTSYGIEGVWMQNSHLSRCIFEDNGVGLQLWKSREGAVWDCLFIGNTTANIATNHGVPIINCVIDGKNKASAIGVSNPDASDGVPKILNTIILDCVIGVQGTVAGMEELSAIFNCCFWLNGTDFTQGAGKRTGCIFADPLFVDKDNKDYGITSTSPCKEAGLDLKSYDYYTSTASRVDIGFLQEARSSSGGRKLGAPLGFSVER